MSGQRLRSWPFWILVVVIASGPWFGVVRQPQWNRVTWIPFRGAEDKPKDVVVNFLMWVPFGWSFAKSARRHLVLSTVAAAAAVSMAVEVPQLFYRLRDPSATDVFMAMCGAAAGSFASQTFHRRHPGGPNGGPETGDCGHE